MSKFAVAVIVRKATYGYVPRIMEICSDARSIMRHCIEKYGFIYCGVIYLPDGSPRLAYQKITGCEPKPVTIEADTEIRQSPEE